MIIGVDVGLNGGITIITDSGVGLGYFVHQMPIIKGEFGAKKGKVQKQRELNEQAVTELFLKYVGCGCHFFIEKQQSMPKQGVASVFKLGYQYGFLVGVAKTLGFTVHTVNPQDWQKEMLGDYEKGKTKEASAMVAKKLLPHQDFTASERSQKPHDGMTDSALIAEFGRRRIYEQGV